MSDGISIILAFNLPIPQVLKDPNEVDNDPLNFFKRAHYKSWHIPLSQADRYLCKVTFLFYCCFGFFQDSKMQSLASGHHVAPAKRLSWSRKDVEFQCVVRRNQNWSWTQESSLDVQGGWSNKFWTSLNHPKVIHKNIRKIIQNWSSISFKNDQNTSQKRYQNVIKMVLKIVIKTC